MGKFKVIIHVNEMDRWNVALGNVSNLLASVGNDNVDAIVLGNGNSVIAYEDPQKIKVMSELSKKGARFRACRNSLNKMKTEGRISVTESELPAFIKIVPAGITEVIRRQHEGYAYLKP
ncbi:MAG TPA: DsrE family protein [Nitrospirota bacterium]|nr:DsrE family protein [Nitrospirota bacterium]